MLAGYLVALGTTPAGQGLHLLGHLATAHRAAPVAAPTYRPEPASVGLPVLTTLRAPAAPHRHEAGRARTHDADGGHHTGPVVRAAFHGHDAPDAGEPDVGEADAGAPHRHGDTVHTHETQAPTAPVVLVRVPVDTHRLPDATRVPAPPSRADAPGEGGLAVLRSVDGSVETPPPIGRG